MIDIDQLYFEWMLSKFEDKKFAGEAAYLCGLLHNCEFNRRVGNDVNRAVNGENLRRKFLIEFEEIDFGPNITNDFLTWKCSWFEMLMSLAEDLDYTYDGGIAGRFNELVTNLEMDHLIMLDPGRTGLMEDYDQGVVRLITERVDNNEFEPNGHGGLFPLRHTKRFADQRRLEIWDQHSAYFRERLEGVLWTSTN